MDLSPPSHGEPPRPHGTVTCSGHAAPGLFEPRPFGVCEPRSATFILPPITEPTVNPTRPRPLPNRAGESQMPRTNRNAAAQSTSAPMEQLEHRALMTLVSLNDGVLEISGNDFPALG